MIVVANYLPPHVTYLANYIDRILNLLFILNLPSDVLVFTESPDSIGTHDELCMANMLANVSRSVYYKDAIAMPPPLVFLEDSATRRYLQGVSTNKR